jgi:hypothetical protein
MGEDHRTDRRLPEVPPCEGQCGRCRLSGSQRVDEDPARVPDQDRQVGEVVTTHLVDAVGHPIEPVLVVELRLAPQARVHAVRGLALFEGVLRGIPDDPTRGVANHEIGLPRHEPARGVLEVSAVREIEAANRLGLCGSRVRGGR